MTISRREFAKIAAGTSLGMFVPYEVLSHVSPSFKGDGPKDDPQANTEGYDRTKHHWAFVVDWQKCIGCGKCVVACKLENNVPMEPHTTRTWVERYAITEEGKVFVDSPEAGIQGFKEDLADLYPGEKIRESFFIAKLCNQCDAAPCTQVCPVSATYKLPDGPVLVDRKRCIGCRYCIQACPYGARYLHPELKVADKCTWCYHRVTKGLRPACVEACPVSARKFGDLNDPESVVSKIVNEQKVYVLKPDLHTRPRVFYVNLPSEVR